MRYMHRAKQSGKMIAAWHKLNEDPRFELVEVADDEKVTVSGYTRIDKQGQPIGQSTKLPPPPVKAAPTKKPTPSKTAGGLAISDSDLDDLTRGA